MRLRKSIFRTPEKIPENRLRPKGPECKNYIFAAAEKHFSHSGENPGKPA
ncbi:Uncharacterized protein dnm_043810 [Desulfonema magnum]|uniref:Uncharacterized protein n=1 Tax=Desulfonema magnum TaxID=45655 RepID=A0A975BN67_9BACT|nr:Uncharacterized protein dnm_043800 [Desulfonema magnum]QTA88338.1 Uncharacterized protein dnm_043810 [Desulfonema magnum]